jgi:hypothetical protein
MKDTSGLATQKFSFTIILKFKQPDWMLDEGFLGPNLESLDPIRIDKRCHDIRSFGAQNNILILFFVAAQPGADFNSAVG